MHTAILPADTQKIGVIVPSCPKRAHIVAALSAGGVIPVVLPGLDHLSRRWAADEVAAIIFDPFWNGRDPTPNIMVLRGIIGATPLLALTPNDRAVERTATLVSGADDAIHAMGDGREIVARTRALVRRADIGAGRMLVCDDLEIDMIHRQVARAGSSIAMPLREFDLLAHLAERIDRPVARGTLLKAVWRIDFDPGTNRIEVHMSRLRRRVDRGHSHAMLRTVKGFGYAMVSRIGARQMPF